MSDLYREPDGFQDFLDNRTRKWEKRKPDLSIEPSWYWSHTGIKPPSDNIVKQIPSQSPPKTPTHGSVSSGVRNKVAGLAPQPPASSSQKVSNVRREDITQNERHIANQILTDCSDMEELIVVCSDLSGTKFQALIAPFIDRLSQFIAGEIINPEHVLLLLRRTLQITISEK